MEENTILRVMYFFKINRNEAVDKIEKYTYYGKYDELLFLIGLKGV